MTPEQIFYKIANFLIQSGKMVTLDKVVSETGIGETKAREALESLSGGGLIYKVEVEEFDENCYQANSKTEEFCEKIVKRNQVSDSAKVNEEQVKEVNSSKEKSASLLENYLIEYGAPENVIKEYRSLMKEKNFYKKRARVWEKHIGEMVSNVTKELG